MPQLVDTPVDVGDAMGPDNMCWSIHMGACAAPMELLIHHVSAHVIGDFSLEGRSLHCFEFLPRSHLLFQRNFF